jgi:hypothetical protein
LKRAGGLGRGGNENPAVSIYRLLACAPRRLN